MPKVLRIINRLNIGGPTYNVAYLAKYLAPEFETLLVAGMKDDSEGDSEFILKNMGIEPRFINEMKREINFKSDYNSYRDLNKIIKEFKPDIVHTHMAKPGTLGRLAALRNNVPIVLHTFHGHYFHSYFSPAKTKIFQRIEQWLAKKTSGIIAISDVQKYELSEVFKIASPEKTFTVPLGFDLSRFTENVTEKRKEFRQQYFLDDDEIAIGIIGRIVPIKNHQLFVDAIDFVLKNSSKKVRAFIIGDGEDKEKIMRQFELRGIKFANRQTQNDKAPVVFTSWIKQIDVALAGLDIVALTSLNEGTPVSLIEAQAASKPIVTTRAGGVENVVLNGETALVSELNQPGLFFENMLSLVEDEALRKKITEQSRSVVMEKFHFTRLVNDMRLLYNSLLNNL